MPIDVASIAADLATWVGAAATAGLAIMAALYGIRLIIRALKSVK